MYGKSVRDLIGSDVKVLADGSVVGTFPYVEGYEQFSSNVSEQSGHFFPFSLTKAGSTMTFKKNGKASKTEIEWEKDNVFRVENSDTFEVEVDGESVVTFNFTQATMKPKAQLTSVSEPVKAISEPAAAPIVEEPVQGEESTETKLTQDDLTDMTVAEIRSLAAQNGYKITATKKADVVQQYLDQQK